MKRCSPRAVVLSVRVIASVADSDMTHVASTQLGVLQTHSLVGDTLITWSSMAPEHPLVASGWKCNVFQTLTYPGTAMTGRTVCVTDHPLGHKDGGSCQIGRAHV